MRHSHFIRTAAAALAFLLCTAAAILPQFSSEEVISAAETLTDTGISYTETTDTILNPGMGYTTTLWYRCAPEQTEVKNPVGSVVLMFIDIGAFSSGENGTKNEDGTVTGGQDYLLDETFFNALRGTFENCRSNGSTVALRFRYDDDGTRDPEPATFDMLKTHIRQIGESGILQDYQDILMFVESGFVGCYGEQWGGKYCSLEEKAELLDLLLDIVPDPIPVTVRTPNIFAKWAGIAQSELADWTSEAGSKAARIGLYDDGYMGSDSDLGTYSNREAETAWLGRQTLTSYFGGEFSGNLEFAQQYDTYLPQNAIPEMYRTHLSYINSNIFKLYQDYTFGSEYDVENVDNSAYYGQSVYQFIRDHLGYRFVIRDCKMTPETPQGGKLQLQLAIENTGFANPIRAQKAELLLEKEGVYYRMDIPADSREWQSCTTSRLTQRVQLPGGLDAGEWKVYLKLSVGEQTIETLPYRSVRFANPEIWNAGLGANYLGTVNVTETDDRTLHCNSGTGIPALYSINGTQLTDGAVSYEGELGTPAAESETAKLYLHDDAHYLYITATFDAKGDAEVHNIQFKNESNGESYWLYYASNGFIYFNHGTPDGVLHRHSDGIAEFRIPYGDVMGLHSGAEISGVRYFLQDSANEWKLLSDVTYQERFALSGNFHIYNAPMTRYLREGDTLTLYALHDAGAGSREAFYCNGTLIEEADQNGWIVNTPQEGDYSVMVTAADGTEQTAVLYHVAAIYSTGIRGDLNEDGTVNTADAVLLQKYLLLRETSLPGWKNGDLNDDSRLTASDLSLLKEILIA